MGGNLTGGSIRILWDAEDTAEVTVTGVGPVAFMVNGSAVSFPYTLSSSTTFETDISGTYTVSVQHHGYEVANTPDGTRGVELAWGQQAIFSPTPDGTPNNKFMADLNQSLTATIGTAVDPLSERITATLSALDASAATGSIPATPSTLVTPDGSGDVTHPSVYDAGEGQTWNGHRYWLAITPMPGSDSTKENPCIYHSDDGVTWTVPAGLTNPIEPHPGGVDYNSDTHLVMDGSTLRCFFRHQIGSDNFYIVRSSDDGVDWSAREVAYTAPLAGETLLSACFTKDADGVWHMHAVDEKVTPNTIVHKTAPAYTGPWSEAVTITIAPPLPEGREPWHLDMHKVGDYWHGLLMDRGATGATAADLYFLNGIGDTFQRSSDRVLPRRGPYWDHFYRSCIVPTTDDEGRYALDTWFAAFGSGRRTIAKGQITFPSRAEQFNHMLTYAGVGIIPNIVADTFNRADTATGLGEADSGQTWTAITATNPFGIADGMAYAVNAANSITTIDLGTPDFYVEVELPVVPNANAAWLMFRRVDNVNFWRIGANSGPLTLQKDVAGAITNLPLPAGMRFSGGVDDAEPRVRLGVKCLGSLIQCYVNGLPWGEPIIDSDVSTGTQVGIQTNYTGVRFDNFIVKPVAAAPPA